MEIKELQFRLKQIADFIIEETYPNVGANQLTRLQSYKLKLTEKEYKSRLGVYHTVEKTVEVSSINGAYFSDVLVVLLHEVAHHIEMEQNRNQSHDESFYKTNFKLLSTAIDCKIITLQEVLEHSNNSMARNRNKLSDMMNKYIPSKNKRNANDAFDLSFVSQYNKLKPISEVVKVRCAPQYATELKKHGYHWEEKEKVWYKTFCLRPEYNTETHSLNKRGFFAVKVENTIYYSNEVILIISGNTYRHKDNLKLLGYTYTNRRWEKRIFVQDYKKEIAKVRSFTNIRLALDFIK